MVQPIDYTIDVASPFESTMRGVQAGMAIRKNRLALADEEFRQQQAQALQQDLVALSEKESPTGEDYAQIITRHPELSEHFKRGWDILDATQQQNKLSQASQVYAAMQSDNPEIAKQILQEQANAARNAGMEEEARGAETMLKLIDLDPNTAKTSAALALSSIMGPDKFSETFSKIGSERRAEELQPAEMTKREADAQSAAVSAKYAEAEAVQDLAKKGWDIKKLANDIQVSKDNVRIAAMKANLAKETNMLKRQELQQKIKEAERKRDVALMEKTAELESAYAGIDNSLNTIDRLLQNPELDNILGAVEGSSFYPSTLVGIVSPFSDADRRADAVADLETVQSQAFLNNLMEAKSKGATFGSLTEREGERLVGYVKNLSRKQSEAQFRQNMVEMQRLLTKARSNLAKKHGVPTREEAQELPPEEQALQAAPDTPAVEPTTDEINAILQKYSGD